MRTFHLYNMYGEKTDFTVSGETLLDVLRELKKWLDQYGVAEAVARDDEGREVFATFDSKDYVKDTLGRDITDALGKREYRAFLMRNRVTCWPRLSPDSLEVMVQEFITERS